MTNAKKTDTEPTWKPEPSPLGLRAIEVAMSEKNLGVKVPYGGPNSSPRVRLYLGGCVRGGDAMGQPDEKGAPKELRLLEGNWCAAFASFCMHQALRAGDVLPHGYRAGVVELVEDATALGRWAPISLVRKGLFVPAAGDLAIWDRSDPKDPKTSWFRHVNRVVSYDPKSSGTADDIFVTIGGNESRTIEFTPNRPKGLETGKLLGFVSYQLRLVSEPTKPAPKK